MMLKWSAVLTVVALSLSPGCLADGNVLTLTHPSGPVCGSSPEVKCLTKATCNSATGVCQCPALTSGHGDFNCQPFPPATASTYTNGPLNTLTTFTGATCRNVWPCKYRHTLVERPLRDTQDKCVLQVIGINKIVKGRILVTGAELNIGIVNTSGGTDGIGIQLIGWAKGGTTFNYVERGRNVFILETPAVDTDESLEDGSGSGDDDNGDDDGTGDDDEDSDQSKWGEPRSLQMGNGQTVSVTSDDDNFLLLDVPDCGMMVKLRAASFDVNQDAFVSGLGVFVTAAQLAFPVTANTYVADQPGVDRLTADAAARGWSCEEQILHKSMSYAAQHDASTTYGSECGDTARAYRLYCDTPQKQQDAMTQCSFLLRDDKVVSCLDPPGGETKVNTVKAFRYCLWNTCSVSSFVCGLLKSQVAPCSHVMSQAIQDLSCSS